MEITEILKRKGHVFEVRLSDGTYVLLDKDIAEEYALSVGTAVTDEELGKIEVKSELYRAKNRAIYYLSDSDYTEKGMKDKLIKAGFEPPFAEKTVERLKELSLISDSHFAENFVQRANELCLSARETTEKLVLKGVDREEARYAVEDGAIPDSEKLLILIGKKYRDKLSDEKSRDKVTSALFRKGFKYSDIKKAIETFEEV